MKKLKFFAGALLLLVTGSVIFLANKPMTAREALILRNVEALAGFEFNNQYWDDESHWYTILGGAWKPVLHDCTGQFSVGYNSTYFISSYEGRMVTCVNGDGNCFGGTDCLPL